MRDRLIELLKKSRCARACDGFSNEEVCKGCTAYERLVGSADFLLENGVIVTPCVAMVEQVLKDGKMDRQKTLHCAGKYSVVYIDKSKWKIPLIDITEQCYNDEKALERIQTLKGGAE